MIIKAFLALAAFAFLLLSGGIAVWVALTLRNARRKVWKTASGVVEASAVVANRRCNGLPGHHYRVSYEFSIDGEEYRSSRVRFGDFRYMTYRRASGTAMKYPVGATVSVHYDPAFQPDHPDREPVTVLEPGLNLECWYPVGVFLVSLAITALCVSIAVRA